MIRTRFSVRSFDSSTIVVAHRNNYCVKQSNDLGKKCTHTRENIECYICLLIEKTNILKQELGCGGFEKKETERHAFRREFNGLERSSRLVSWIFRLAIYNKRMLCALRFPPTVPTVSVRIVCTRNFYARCENSLRSTTYINDVHDRFTLKRRF